MIHCCMRSIIFTGNRKVPDLEAAILDHVQSYEGPPLAHWPHFSPLELVGSVLCTCIIPEYTSHFDPQIQLPTIIYSNSAKEGGAIICACVWVYYGGVAYTVIWEYSALFWRLAQVQYEHTKDSLGVWCVHDALACFATHFFLSWHGPTNHQIRGGCGLGLGLEGEGTQFSIRLTCTMHSWVHFNLLKAGPYLHMHMLVNIVRYTCTCTCSTFIIICTCICGDNGLPYFGH